MSSTIKHGGNLREAAALYDIPLASWMDLSTGINPFAWQPPAIPPAVWQRLPEEDDELLDAAKKYYGCESLLPIAGSQAAIQSLPYCRKPSRVAIVSPCYAEHPYWWQKAGHEVLLISPDDVEQYLPTIDVLLLINPNNPDTRVWSPHLLQQWHQQLSKQGGWLVVDEAFIDSTPALSLLRCYKKEMPSGLIVLRSIGKFFGLAGIRLGFVAAEHKILKAIGRMQGPWSISHPARWVGANALADTAWHELTRKKLVIQSQLLHQVLQKYFDDTKSSHYFCYLKHPKAEQIQALLAAHGIWVRYFDNPSAIRLGLTTSDEERSHLDKIFSIIFASIK